MNTRIVWIAPTVERHSGPWMVTVMLILMALLLRSVAASTVTQWTRLGPDGGSVTAFAIDPQTPTRLYAGTRVGGVFKSLDGGENWQPANDGLVDVAIYRGGPGSLLNVDVRDLPRLSVVAMAIDPVASATVYAATEARDIFKSTNGGKSWSGVYVGETMQQITSLVVNPKMPATLYASGWPVAWKLGQPRSNPISPWVGGGVLKSTDGGKSWRPVNTGLTDLAGPVLAIDPQTPSTLYAGTQRGVFKTTDGGNNWHRASNGLPDVAGGVTAFAIDPRTPATIFVAVREPTGTLGSEYTPVFAIRVYKSADAGGSWKPVGASRLPTPQVKTLAIDRHASTTLFAATTSGVFKSIDNGENWRPLTSVLSDWVHALAVDPQKPDTVYTSIGSAGIFKTLDGGESWRLVNRGLIGLDLYASALAFDPKSPTLYASTTSGLFKSSNGGASWRPITGSVHTLCCLALDSKTPATIYAGTLGKGVFKSSDAGDSWQPINAGLGDFVTVNSLGDRTTVRVRSLAVDPQTPTTVYMMWTSDPFETPSGVYKSTDAGANWSAINAGLPERRMILALVIAPSAPTTIYLSLGHIYKTIDGGRMWTPASKSPGVGYALAVDPHTPDIVYASGPPIGYVNCRPTQAEGRLFKSTDGGRSWRSIDTGLTDLNVSTIAIDPQTPTTLYAGAHGGCPRVDRGGVFKSIDGGTTWHPINGGLMDLDIFSIAIDPTTPSKVYALTTHGIFVLKQ